MSPTTTIDWQHWLQRWDEQQTRYLPEREERFTVMLDALAALLPPDFVALDLACGPGAISQRLLVRFPQACTIALDYNPVLLHLGRQALGTMGGRISWLAQSLNEPSWTEPVQKALAQLGRSQFDAVLSTTALHWLPIGQLTQVYNQLGALVRSGGVLLNGDHMAYPPSLPVFRQLATEHSALLRRVAFEEQGGEDYRQWWDAITQGWLAADPSLQQLFDQYQANERGRNRSFSEPIELVHRAALIDAGFTQVDTLWQRYDNRVLLAVRGQSLEPVQNGACAYLFTTIALVCTTLRATSYRGLPGRP
ncbi:class I SAM-dependent methyltransferase [Candidatus Gracilibacteria bacterium]|nr:class I SAM-dependent methyltransferase [Candidatus Gracilibacteria bacterium]